MDNSDLGTLIKPRIASRGLKDFLVVAFIVLPVQLIGLLVIPAAFIYMMTHSWTAAILVAAIIYFVFMSLVVTALRVTSEGIHFLRRFGNPKFLSWEQIKSVSVAPPKELIIYGWLWPLLPAREMTASFSCLQHYRIQWQNGYCYFPPLDTELFEHCVSQNLSSFVRCARRFRKRYPIITARSKTNMNGKANEIASQLRGIKKALIFIAACFFIGAVTNVYLIVDDVRENTERRRGITFYEQATTLRRERGWDELLKLAQSRLVERPRDPYAFWFSGIAHFQRDELDQAESDFKRMVEIDKGFKESGDNMLKAVEDKRKEKEKAKPK